MVHYSLLPCAHYAFSLSAPKRKNNKTSWQLSSRNDILLLRLLSCRTQWVTAPNPLSLKEQVKKRYWMRWWEEHQHRNLQDGRFGIYKIDLPGQSSPHAFLPSRLAARLSAPLLGSCTTLYLSWSIWSQKIWIYVCLRGMAVWDQITYTVMMSEFSCGRVDPQAHSELAGH